MFYLWLYKDCGVYHSAWDCIGIVLDGTVDCVTDKKGTET
nr:MAG TPA: hypothetical protein [Caudoviricetes sp.]